PTIVDPHIAAGGPAQLLQPLREGRDPRQRFRILDRDRLEHTDAPHALGLLRACCERPCRRPANERDELAPLHSITSSARPSSVAGTSRPSALAVFKLITSSYLVGACTGRPAALSPLRIRSTYPAARRYWLGMSGP